MNQASAIAQPAGVGTRLVPTGSVCNSSTQGVPSGSLAEPDFAAGFLGSNRMPGVSRSAAMVCSMAIQTLLLTAVLVIPLLFTASPDLRSYALTMLVAPLPPPALPAPIPVAPRAIAPQARKTFVRQGKMIFPMSIPKHAAVVSEAPAPPEVNPSVGGVYGGLPADLTGIMSAGLAEAPPPPPPPVATGPVISQPKKPFRVGGDVRAPRSIFRVEPQYPTLARQARIEGDVLISAIIDAHGSVIEMKAVSGPPMLYPAAMAALSQWKFEPTYLNGEAWPVEYAVTLHFRIDGGRHPTD